MLGQVRKSFLQKILYWILSVSLSLSPFRARSRGALRMRGSKSGTKIKFGAHRARRSQTVLIVPVAQKLYRGWPLTAAWAQLGRQQNGHSGHFIQAAWLKRSADQEDGNSTPGPDHRRNVNVYLRSGFLLRLAIWVSYKPPVSFFLRVSVQRTERVNKEQF